MRHLFRHHITFESLLHLPHKWLLGVLLSPIRAAGWYYMKRYHMTYIHAKKVFLFDFFLVLLTLTLFGTTLFWFFGTPEATAPIKLSITQIEHESSDIHARIRSGEHLKLTALYEHTGNKPLSNASLIFRTPRTFLFDEFEDTFGLSQKTIPLGDLSPGQTGEITVSGRLFGVPDQELPIAIQLIYTNAGEKTLQRETRTLLATPRDSILGVQLSLPDRLLSQGSAPFALTLTNNYHHETPTIEIPLDQGPSKTFIPASTTIGIVIDNTWVIEHLPPFGRAEMTGEIKTNLPKETKESLIEVIPRFIVQGNPLPQVKVETKKEALYAVADLSLSWDRPSTKGGEKPRLSIAITNSGTADLENLTIALKDEKKLIAVKTLLDETEGRMTEQGIQWDRTNFSPLSKLLPDETKIISLDLPLVKESTLTGTDILFAPSITLTAGVKNMPKETRLETDTSAPPLPVGTTLALTPELRYFTVDGDQLGRGPLPPVVGKETKYWAIFTIKNTTSKVSQLILTARLSNGATWGEKTSVTHGAGIAFDPAQRTVSWVMPSLGPHTEATIAFQIGLLPTVEHIGTHPRLFQTIQLTATDAFVGLPITLSLPLLDISLKNDLLGQAKGTTVTSP